MSSGKTPSLKFANVVFGMEANAVLAKAPATITGVEEDEDLLESVRVSFQKHSPTYIEEVLTAMCDQGWSLHSWNLHGAVRIYLFTRAG
jgi:hypothetical protein